jgi:hypothetical protein
LKKSPRSALLGGLLFRAMDESESPTSGIPKEMLTRGAQTALALSGQQDENLYIALRTARLAVAAELSEATDAVARPGSPSKPVGKTARAAATAHAIMMLHSWDGITQGGAVSDFCERIAGAD